MIEFYQNSYCTSDLTFSSKKKCVYGAYNTLFQCDGRESNLNPYACYLLWAWHPTYCAMSAWASVITSRFRCYSHLSRPAPVRTHILHLLLTDSHFKTPLYSCRCSICLAWRSAFGLTLGFYYAYIYVITYANVMYKYVYASTTAFAASLRSP
jgi:hypothetical protein